MNCFVYINHHGKLQQNLHVSYSFNYDFVHYFCPKIAFLQHVCLHIVESARDVPYGVINLQELILRAHTSVVFKGRRAG
jgi:hypothetical protein